MKTRVLIAVAVLVFVFALILVACGGSKEEIAPGAEEKEGAPATLDGKALVEERCTKCHDLKRVETAKKTRDEWQTTVERMVTKGAELNEAEQQAAIDYLTEAYPK